MKSNSFNHLDTAVIMAGGQGTRLRSITGPLPKAMVNIKNTAKKNFGSAKDTILEHQIDVLSQNGITNFILVVGAKKEFIKTAFTNGIINRNLPNRNINIQFFEEQAPLGTGGSFCSKELQEMTKNKDFLFTYSDVLFDVNVQDMYAFHKEQNANATILISPCANPDDRPLCCFNKGQKEIVSMIPKQGKEDGPRGGLFPNTPKNGLMILNDSFFDVLPEDPVYLDFEENILMKLIYDNKYKVCGWKTPCYIKDIGVVSRFYEGVNDLEQNIPSYKNPTKFGQSCVIIDESNLIKTVSPQVTIDENVSYAISQFNSNGIITILYKDEPLNYQKEDDLIDTLLVRSSNPAYIDAKVSEFNQIKNLCEEWNISPSQTHYISNFDDYCLRTTLEPHSPQIISTNIISATNEIINEHLTNINNQLLNQQNSNSLENTQLNDAEQN